MLRITETIDYLASCVPVRPSIVRTSSTPTASSRTQKWLLIGGGAFFVVLLGIYLYSRFFPALSKPVIYIALICAGASFLLGVSAISIEIFGFVALAMSSIKSRSPNRHLAEVAADEAHARVLMKHSDTTLKYTQYWLKLKLVRVERPLGQLMGKEVALLPLPFGALALLKGFDISKIFDSQILHTAYSAAIGGVFIGTSISIVFCIGYALITLYVQHRRYVYQLELVELAMQLKALIAEAAPTVSPTVQATMPGQPARRLRWLRWR